MAKYSVTYSFTIALTLTALVATGGCSSVASGPAPLPLVQSPAQRAERTTIREFNDLLPGSAYYHPSALASGPKGDLWIADDVDQDFGACAVVQIARSGAKRNAFYYGGLTSEGADFADITGGPDGALWITDDYNGQILRMTTGGSYDNYPLGSPAGSAPAGIAAGSDGALWFVGLANFAPAVGRITTLGKITFFTSGISSGASLQDITAGPDGAMWFTEPATNKVGRITMHGKITEYSSGITPGGEPYSITAGPDNALWFTEMAGGRIGRITTKGHVTEFSKGITPTEQPSGIALGPDQALWFTEYETDGSYRTIAAKIGRITTAGAIHEYSHLNQSSEPGDIVAGPDGNLWFVEMATDKLGRIRL